MSLQPVYLCPRCLSPQASPDFPIPCPDCDQEDSHE